MYASYPPKILNKHPTKKKKLVVRVQSESSSSRYSSALLCVRLMSVKLKKDKYKNTSNCINRSMKFCFYSNATIYISQILNITF